MATRIFTSVLVCLIVALIIETTSVHGSFKAMPDCKTDASCGANSLTASVGATDYCCASASKLSLRVKTVKGKTQASCKCLNSTAKGFRNPRFCARYKSGQPIPCGKDAVTGTANGKNVCCGANYTINIKTKTRNGAQREYCRCKAIKPAAAAPAKPAPAAPAMSALLVAAAAAAAAAAAHSVPVPAITAAAAA